MMKLILRRTGRLFSRAVTGLWVVLLFLQVGCCNLKKLEPAFETNKKNIQELQENVKNSLDMLDRLGRTVFAMQLEAKRTAVAFKVTENFRGLMTAAPVNVTAAAVEQELGNAAGATGQKFARFRDAIQSAEEPRRIELRRSEPVFAAYLEQQIRSDQIADDINRLAQAAASPNISQVRRDVADKYPLVQEVREAQRQFLDSMPEYRQTILTNQLGIAQMHADLFDYAAKSSINVEKAFRSVISDEALQKQVLGMIGDPNAKSAVKDSFDFLMKLGGNSNP